MIAFHDINSYNCSKVNKNNILVHIVLAYISQNTGTV